MTLPDRGPEPQDVAADEEETVRARAERRRRLAEVFGDVLPTQTSDDRDAPSGEGEAGHEEWLRRQVPPHHG